MELDCEPLREAVPVSDTGPQAAIGCAPSDGPADDVTMLAFTEVDASRDAWTAQVESLDPVPVPSADACEQGLPGTRRWGFGSIACTIEDGRATIHWTDQRIATYGVAQAADADIGQLYAWWREAIRPLGRPDDTTDAAPSDPRPDAPAGPLVRVPGAPTDISCAAESEPIVDLRGRTWRIDRIRFIDRQGYERVVLHLERSGRNGNGRGGQLVARRVPVSQMGSALPGLPRPRRGNLALAVRIEGITGAARIRNYRPTGVSLVREVSVLGRGRARTVLFGLAGGTCYQVRVPVWGPSASGNERSAVVYVDLRRPS